jgi:chromate reductase, NAD(P)H dehydrogenase (quinone)
MRLLGISGSLRRDSHNTRLLRVAARLAPPPVELELFDGLKDVPPYDEDDDVDPAPDAARRLRQAIAGADALLIATPEYNSSLPGQLKNALDWASRPSGESALAGKPAAAIGASKSMFGGVWAQAELRKVMGTMGGRVIETELPVAHAHDLLNEGKLELEPQQAERLEEILAELIASAERLGEPDAVAA